MYKISDSRITWRRRTAIKIFNMNNSNVTLLTFILFFLSYTLVGVTYLCIKEYSRKDISPEVVGVHSQLQEMGNLILTLDSLNSQKVEPAIYKIEKNYYEIKGVQRVQNQDSLVQSINQILGK